MISALGSITDGDIREALKDSNLSDTITTIMNKGCRRIVDYNLDTTFVKLCRELGISYVPIVNELSCDIINIHDYQEIVNGQPIMAGGKGLRLPLPRTFLNRYSKWATSPLSNIILITFEIWNRIHHAELFG
jgi:hypothetical protein